MADLSRRLFFCRSHQPLFPVKYGFDVQGAWPTLGLLLVVLRSDLQEKQGLTMVFDKSAQALRIEEGMRPQGGVAWGQFSDEIQRTGWSELHVGSSDDENMANDVKMYAHGPRNRDK